MHLRLESIIGSLAVGVVFGVALGSNADAQTGGGYDLRWSSLDGGASTSTSASYRLSATIAQPEAGNLTGGAYAMHGGFWHGTETPTDVSPELPEGNGPLVFRLHGNAPNPFKAATSIQFSLEQTEHVELRVYDLAGRLVCTVLERDLGPGRHQVVWEGRTETGRRVAHGIYMLRLTAGKLEARRKMALVP